MDKLRTHILNKTKEDIQKREKQNSYYADLSMLNSIKHDLKVMDGIKKEEEKELIDKQAELAENTQKEINQEDRQFKRAMGKDYIKEMANMKRKQLEDKLRSINEDNTHLKLIEKQTQEEKYHNSLYKANLRSDRENDLKLKNEIKNKAHGVELQEKMDYRKMIDDNIQKEISKEQEYKNLIQRNDNKMQNRVKHYQEYLQNNENRRSHDTKLWEHKYYNEKLKSDELVMNDNKMRQLNNTRQNFDIVKQQLERKQQERMKDAEFMRKSIELR